MTTALAQLPWPLRALNRTTAIAGPLGRRLLHLDPDRLMAQAASDTGLDDFGPDYFRAPLALLCESLETDAQLNALGRIIARKDILRLLGNRLQFVDIFKRHPEIAQQPVPAPIFILGMPRTGTTSLHELLSLDQRLRAPLSWEVAHPFPPPERASYQDDPRIEQVEAELAGVDNLLPGFKHMHPMGARLPQECVSLFSHDFASMIFDVQFRLDRYQAWLLREDMGEVFRNHRRWLQLLQWKCPAESWVLKSPQYLWNIDDMLREYPDARVIQCHRDPVKVALSIGSLTTTLRSLGSDRVDLQQATREYADLLDYGTGKTLSARRRGLLPADRVIDVQFAEFRHDPMAMVTSLYEFFSLELTEQARAAMAGFLERGRQKQRHGQHGYTLAGSGLDLQTERRRFAEYQATYDIPCEPMD